MDTAGPEADKPAADPEAEARAREIAELMATPVRPHPAVIVVGDDAVFGFTPAPAY